MVGTAGHMIAQKRHRADDCADNGADDCSRNSPNLMHIEITKIKNWCSLWMGPYLRCPCFTCTKFWVQSQNLKSPHQSPQKHWAR